MFAKVNDVTAFRIAAVEPPRHLLWAKPDSTWEWQLTEHGDFSMMRKMLRTLKQRAE